MKAGFVLFIPWACAAVTAQISPGPLHKAHARLEGLQNCTQCHAAGKKSAPEKCLTCHSLILSGMNAGKGMHRRGTHDRCETCHIEHHGRDFDLVYWQGGEKAFNHAGTGFALKGAHERLDCRACHRPEFIADKEKVVKGGGSPDRTFLGLKPDCAACHDDPHMGQFGLSCGDCHDETQWKPASRFSHDSTRFALTGRHRTVACGKCHAAGKNPASSEYPEYRRYAGTRFGTCADCHADGHDGRMGRACETCHVTEGWDKINPGAFRHEMTGYPLLGRHSQVKCGQCHVPGKPLKIGRHEQCSDCHADIHAGRFSRRPEHGDCSACHSEEGFSPARFTVSRHAGTRFPLTGAHLAVPCIACHSGVLQPGSRAAPRFDFPDIRCGTCHADPHHGNADRWIQTGGCEICHLPSAWRDVRFDHDRTRFRLEGRHQAAACRACHSDTAAGEARAVLRFKGKSMACGNCHHDPHMGQFSVKTGNAPGATPCDRCHSATGWPAEKFDHDRDSQFPLTGAHRALACGKCHLAETRDGFSFIRYKPVPHRCDSCHGVHTSPDEGVIR
jgi:hypothetical protein